MPSRLLMISLVSSQMRKSTPGGKAASNDETAWRTRRATFRESAWCVLVMPNGRQSFRPYRAKKVLRAKPVSMTPLSVGQPMESKRRSIAKTVSWRFLAVIVTGTVVWVLTGEPGFALKVGVVDTLVKLLIYYFHERAWNRVSFGRPKPPEYEI